MFGFAGSPFWPEECAGCLGVGVREVHLDLEFRRAVARLLVCDLGPHNAAGKPAGCGESSLLMSVVQTRFRTKTSSGTPILVAATLEYKDGRIWFIKSPYSLKDEIKAMRGSKWHGYEEENPRKIWSVEDCQRNRFQLSFLMGQKAYAGFDRPQIKHEDTRLLKDHQ